MSKHKGSYFEYSNKQQDSLLISLRLFTFKIVSRRLACTPLVAGAGHRYHGEVGWGISAL